MRVVLDTNVLMSAVLSPAGKSAQILRLVKNYQVDLVFSPATAAECLGVLHYPKIRKLLKKRSISIAGIEKFLRNLIAGSVVVMGELKVNVVKSDPSDNKFIECALAGQADFIVSGDAHLLKLKKFRKIPILNPKDFLDMVIS
jgi:putative PIN family toxin of toxin-antitoxin system